MIMGKTIKEAVNGFALNSFAFQFKAPLGQRSEIDFETDHGQENVGVKPIQILAPIAKGHGLEPFIAVQFSNDRRGVKFHPAMAGELHNLANAGRMRGKIIRAVHQRDLLGYARQIQHRVAAESPPPTMTTRWLRKSSLRCGKSSLRKNSKTAKSALKRRIS